MRNEILSYYCIWKDWENKMVKLDNDQIVSEFLQGFNNKNMILFVGTSILDDELAKIAKYPWAGVVTSRRDERLKTLFVNDNRKVRECESFDDIPPKMFGKENLNIIRLFGVDKQAVLEDDEELREARLKSYSNRIWNHVVSRLDVASCMCVVGYNYENEQEFSRVDLIISLDQIRGGSLFFFGIKDENETSKKLKKLVEDRGHQWCEEELNTLIIDEDDTFSYDDSNENGQNIFWMGGKAVSVPDRIVMPMKGTATLLTENLVYAIRPYGRVQQSRWFQEFLSRSAEYGPQWYGYIKQSEFYLKRDYEEILFSWVKNILGGHEPNVAEYKDPIVLEGHPGSSKSISLAALAMHVFEEKQYPVIFISQKELNNKDYDMLDNLMRLFKDMDADHCKTLIVWDGSTYSNTTKVAKEMAAYLANRGRRFLLVCSAYKTSEEIGNDTVLYKYLGDGKYAKSQSEHDVKYVNGCFYIHASRTMSERELFELKNKVSLYCSASALEILSRWKKLQDEENNNIFYYFYKLMVLLQPPLENNLRIEHGKVSSYVQKRLDLLQEKKDFDDEQKPMSTMQQALVDAGIDISEYQFEEENDEVDNYKLERFNTCVALFSRFKIDTPISLALSVLSSRKEDMNLYGERYKNLFKELTTGIPWIIYKESADGEFSFVYRSQLEADIFLRKTCILDIDAQIELIMEMLGYYYEEYKRFDCVDKTLKTALQKLLRMIGPNSEYIEFKNSDNAEHKEFLSKLDRIIKKIQWLRKECSMPDEDASFAIIEITFIREYYSSKICSLLKDDSILPEIKMKLLSDYIKIISDACILAQKCINSLEIVDAIIVPKNMRSNSINSLSVEIARCSYILNDTISEYNRLSETTDINGILDLNQIHVLPYKDLYNLLKKTIYSDPQNGYSYNALFQAFEQEYRRANKVGNKKRCFQLLSEILLIADEAHSLGDDIHNRGANKDELGEHLLKISELSDETVVTIDQVKNKTWKSEFANLFEEMLSEGNAAGICYVSRHELASVKDRVDSDGVIAPEAICVYEKVKNFMRDEAYFDTIKRSSQALYLLFQVTWGTYAQREVNNGECRTTNLTIDEWKEILEICELYRNADRIPRPIITLMHALSVVQISWDYEEASRIISSLREDMFFGRRRTSVPYMVSEGGKAKLYDGKVVGPDSTRDRRVRLDGIHRWSENSERGILYPRRNFVGNIKNLENGETLTQLELGIGYLGFSLYTEEERKKKEARV